MRHSNPKYLRESLSYEKLDSHDRITYSCYVSENGYTITKFRSPKPQYYFSIISMETERVSIVLDREKKTATVEKEYDMNMSGGRSFDSEKREIHCPEFPTPYKYALRCWNILDKLMKTERTDEATSGFGNRIEMLLHFDFATPNIKVDTMRDKFKIEQAVKDEESEREKKAIELGKPANSPHYGK